MISQNTVAVYSEWMEVAVTASAAADVPTNTDVYLMQSHLIMHIIGELRERIWNYRQASATDTYCRQLQTFTSD